MPDARAGHADVARPTVSVRAPVLAHEVRAAIAVAIGAVEALRLVLLRAEVDRDEVRHLARVAERSNRLASRLLDRLELANDVDRGTVELTTRRTDLSRLVRDSVDDLADVVLPGHPVTVVTVGRVAVVLDDAAVREIVFHLLSNAGEYSAAGAGIDVSVEKDDTCVRVVVRDHGSGVPPGDGERIFRRSVQGDPRNPGLGLGLYVARGLALAHGGDLSLRAASASGSEFVLELPIDGPTPAAPAA